MRIDSSTILISGGSSGLGYACAVRMLQCGAKVILVDIAAPPDSMLAAAAGNCMYLRET